ncbi:MAG: FKBP-type peptidyl-prolyl cis-trans isomerase [Bdellovibrionales bacterium]
MKPQIVSFNCILKNSFGKVLSSTFNNDVITQAGGEDSLLIGLAEGLQNLVKGEKRKIVLGAERAYGFYDPSKVMEFERDELPDGTHLRKGDEVTLAPKKGGKPMNLRVTSVRGDHITLDGNHPLAGQDLIFEIEATDARECTPEEIEQIGSEEETGHLH